MYPPRRPEEDWARDLWQSRGRAQAPASAERRFRLEFAPPELRVHELLSGGPNRMEHRIVDYRIVAGFGDFDTSEIARSTRSGIPAFMAPCHLDAGDIVDYAGIRPAPSPTVPWTSPVNDVVLAVDDREPQTIRTKALEAAISIADFDADGDADLIVEWNDYLDGPPREVMLSLASRKRFNHTIAVYVQEVGGSFSRRARELLTVPMRFDAPLSDGGRRWNEYRSGGLTSTQGDFNGDKRADVAVWFAPSRIAIHMNHEGLYHREADVELTVPDGFARMAAVDIDGDGKSDLVLVPASAETAPKVFFSR